MSRLNGSGKFILSFMILFILTLNENVFSFQCKGEMIFLGEFTSDVTKKCGTPYLQDRFKKEFIKIYANTHITKEFIDVEYWLYDLALPNIIQLLEFNDNKLIKVKKVDLQKRGNLNMTFCQDPVKDRFVGLTKPQILLLCGDPNMVEKKEEATVKVKKEKDFDLFVTKKVDEWVYGIGYWNSLSILRFENGIITRVSSRLNSSYIMKNN